MAGQNFDEVEINHRAQILAEETILDKGEAEVQAWLEAGADRGQIANRIGRAVSTVDSHRQEIKRKLRQAKRTVEYLNESE